MGFIFDFYNLIYRAEKAVVGLFRKKKPAYVYFSKHANERMHCREYDR